MFAAALAVAAPAHSKAVTVVEPLPKDLIGSAHVVATEVIVGPTAKSIFDQLENFAASKRSEAHLAAFDAAAIGQPRPAPDTYAMLPFANMMPLMIEDVTHEWHLDKGRPVKLTLTVDMLRTLDAGMAILLGSADQLAGDVVVSDAETGAKIGEFYVDVLNIRAGLLGLAIRGSGVREKLAAEFAKHVSEQLSGQKSKPQAGGKA